MKTLKELKAAMVPGTTLMAVNHVHPHLSGLRTVLVAQSNRWCLSLPESHPDHGPGEGSWLSVPAASRCTFDGDSVTISRAAEWNDRGPFLTLVFNYQVPA